MEKGRAAVWNAPDSLVMSDERHCLVSGENQALSLTTRNTLSRTNRLTVGIYRCSSVRFGRAHYRPIGGSDALSRAGFDLTVTVDFSAAAAGVCANHLTV